MRHFKFLRSTPLRLALIFGGLFLGAFLVSGFSVYEIMRWEMLKRHDKAISELYASMAENKGDDDTDFLDTVEANVRATRGHDRVILAAKAGGTVLAGNIPFINLHDGWSTIPAYKLGLHGHRQYRLFAGPAHNDRLIVGQSYQDIDELQKIAAVGFGWTSIIVVLLALSGASLIARGAQRRFRAMQHTMDRISKGDFSARLPLLGKGDDVDQLSIHVNRALQQLEATVEGMRQVSVDIAHDLKTPLNRLRINIDEARSEVGEKGKAGIALEAATAEIQHVNQTFEALLRISQLESGAKRTRFRKLGLNKILLETADLYDGALENKQNRISLELAPQDCTVHGDRELLIQLYCNLVENALRHCPTGTHIRISTVRSPNGPMALVEDSGPGIPVEEREKVFRRLYRLERSRSTPGTGLGLSLVKAIADLHGAQVVLEDARPGLRVVTRFAGEAPSAMDMTYRSPPSPFDPPS